MADEPKVITVAAGQLQARLMNEADQTLASIEALIRQAADKRVELFVLPECAYPAYLLGSVTSYRAGDHMSGEQYVAWLREQAARHGLHIVSGFVEEADTALYNAAVLIDEQGREIGRTRKRFLWHVDHDWFAPGDEIRCFDTTLGRIGIVICAETRAPEIVATLVAQGAELLAMPTCWINGSTRRDQYVNPQVDFLMEARAREFGLPVVCADKCGYEQGTIGYVGMSRVYRADGSIAAEAPPQGEMVMAARIVRRAPARVWVSDTRRERILSDRPAITPDTKPARRVTLAAVPTVVTDERFADGTGEALFEPLKVRGVNLLLMNVTHEESAKRLATLAKAFDIQAIGFPTRADVFELGTAKVGCVAGQWAKSFAAARALALDGAAILLFFDVPDDLAILRARALENRVFIAGVSQRFAVIIDPNGNVLAKCNSSHPTDVIAKIDLAEAGNKTVAPQTNIFNERQPSLCHF